MPFFSAPLIKRTANERLFATALAQYAVFRSSAAGGMAISLFAAISGRTLGTEGEQTPLGDHQIRQAEQRHQLRRVLGQSAVTDLLQSEAVLDDVEGMFDLGANAGLDRFELVAQPVDFLAHVQCAPLTWPQGDIPAYLALGFRPPLGPLIPGIAEAFLLFTMQERLRLSDVIDVRRRTDDRVHQPRVGINADVGLHAEVPLIALLGLMHLGVAFAHRRSAIEPAIGHMKNDGRLRRNWLKGSLGDALHAVLCGAGHNLRMTLRALRLYFAFLLAKLSALLPLNKPINQNSLQPLVV